MSPTPASELFTHFRVELDGGASPIFRGGDRICGHVKIQLKREAVIDVIRIQFKGRAVNKDKKGHEIENVFFDKDFVLLERPPGKADPGHFTWQKDFEYSLPFVFVLPLGCPTSYEGGPNAFVRYFARVTFQTSENHSPVYISKRHFSVYDVETVAAVNPEYEEPYTWRRTFTSGGCCCKRQTYFELVMPKRVFYAGDNIEARLLVDNLNDERIAHNIQCNIVERTTKPEISDTDALKYPARVVKSVKVDGTNVEKTRNTIKIGSILIPSAVPLSSANAVAIASLPKDKSSPQLSPDDQASKLFEHPSVISQSRKEPIFRVHYALQILIGKHIIEVPFVVRPVESEDVRNALRGTEEVPLKFVDAETTETLQRDIPKDLKKVVDHYAEPDEQDKIYVGEPDYRYAPLIPLYTQRPVDEHQNNWPPLGTYGANGKLIWNPDKKSKKDEVAEVKRRKSEEQAARKKQKKENHVDKKVEKELLISDEPKLDESPALSVEPLNETRTTEPDPSLIALQSTSGIPPMEDVEAPKKSKAELKREEKELKKLEKEAARREKERIKQEKIQAKIDAKERKKREQEQKKREKEDAKQKKSAEAKQQKAAEVETQKPEEEAPVDVSDMQLTPQFDTDAEIVEHTTVITETTRTIEQHGDGPATIHETITVTEQKSGDEGPVTTTVEYTDTVPVLEDTINNSGLVEPQSSPVVTVTDADESEVLTNGVPDGNIQSNGHHNGTDEHHNEADEQSDTDLLKKKKQADTDNIENSVPLTEA